MKEEAQAHAARLCYTRSARIPQARRPIACAARHATLNINAIDGGQVADLVQTPCVADRCTAVFDRRFLLEESFGSVRAEVVALLDGLTARVPDFRYELADRLVVHPVRTPDASPVVTMVERAVERVLGTRATLVASPGTYDHKHVAGIAGIEHCVAYGPGVLEMAHQPDEWCAVDDLVNATKVLALAALGLLGS